MGENLIPVTPPAFDSDAKALVYSLFTDSADNILYGTLLKGFSVVSPRSLLLWILLAMASIYLYTRWRSYCHYLRSKALAVEVENKTKDLALANAKLQKLSNSDSLTNVLNRRGFYDVAN